MGIPLNFRFDSFDNYFCLMFDDRPREPAAVWQDEVYEYRFHLIRGLRSGDIVGFSNEGGDLAQDYPRLMELLEANPVPGRYDLPDLGLTDATLPEIITAIYERYVGEMPGFTYPIVGERVPALQVADQEHKKEDYAN